MSRPRSTQAICILLWALTWGVGGCSDESPGDPYQRVEDAGPQQKPDLAPVGRPDSAGPPPGPPPTQLPLDQSAVLRIGTGGGLDVASAVFGDLPSVDVGSLIAGGAFVVYDHFDTTFTRGELRSALLGELKFSNAPNLALMAGGSAAYEASPSAVTLGQTRYLYSLRAATLQGPGTLWRRALKLSAETDSPESWGAAEEIQAPSLSLLSWPQVVALPDGRAALAYRNAFGRPQLALSSDGKRFESAREVSAEAVAMVAIGSFADGQVVMTYQAPKGSEAMVSWVRLSRDGQSWSAPTRVSTASSNVHDTTVVRRADGGVDLYYIFPPAGSGFLLFRRQLRADGSLGAEEQVTDGSVGEVSKPAAARLQDGRLLLTFAEISSRDPVSHEPSEQRLAGLLIRGDAP